MFFITQKKEILGSFAFSCHGTSFCCPLIYNGSQAFVCICDITIFWRAQATYFEACFSVWVYCGVFLVFFFPPLMIRFKSHTFVRNTTGSVIFPLLLFVLLRGTGWQFGQVPRGGIGWVFLHRRVCNCIYREDIQRLKNTTFHPPLVSAFHWVVQWWFSKFIIPSLVLDFCHKS